jgi:outer membrane protein assembly factor BamC
VKTKPTTLIQASLVLALGLLTLASCATVDSQATYTSSAPRANDNLATPPGLTSPELNSDYKMTDPQKAVYKVTQTHGMAIQSGGTQRWLVIESQSVVNIWPTLLNYMNQLGLAVKYQNPAIGVVQSDWASRNTAVPQGAGVRGLFDWIGWGSMYSLNSKFMYRVTLWQDQNNVVMLVTNYQMDEEYRGCASPGIDRTSSFASSDQQATKWVARPANPQLELEFLAQYMVFAGQPQNQVKTQVAQIESAPKAAMISGNQLIVKDQFDRAWWRVAVALERVGLGIYDKNRSTGQYLVYPLGSRVANPDPGFLSKMFSKESSNTTLKPVYTLNLQASGNTTTMQMQIINANESATSADAKAIPQYLQALATELQ